MWLASVSHRIDDLVHPAERFGDAEFRLAYQLLKRAMTGVGDDRWARHFRMCTTQCLHRGLSDEELDRLPEDWKAAPAVDIAGGPVEVFWSRGIPEGVISCDPCESLRYEPFAGPDGALARDW